VDRIGECLTKGVDVNALNLSSTSALMYASEYGRTSAVQFLLKHGANPNQKDDGNRTALLAASKNGYTDTVKALLDGGAEISVRRDPETASNAVGEGDTKTVVVFSSDSGTPLSAAVGKGHTETLKVLLARGVDPREAVETLVNYLIMVEPPPSDAQTESIQYLLQAMKAAGIDLDNMKDKFGRPFLMNASHPDGAQVLIRCGANANGVDKDGVTVLMNLTNSMHLLYLFKLHHADSDAKL
jgi:uncharacterized protein